MKPTIGRIVHYVLSRHDGVHDGNGPYNSAEGKIVPAIITAVWSDTCVNLLVFLDGSNHGYDQRRHPDKPGGFENIAAVNRWVTSACLSEEHAPRTWHWPPQQPVEVRPPQPLDEEVPSHMRLPPPVIIGPGYGRMAALEQVPVTVVHVPTPAGDKLVMAEQPNEVLAIESAPNSHPADGGPAEIAWQDPAPAIQPAKEGE